MKVSNLVEALECANKMFKKKHGIEMEIFDMHFSEDGYDGAMHIQAVRKVIYHDAFGWGSKTGTKPHEDIKIDFAVDPETESIEDHSVTFEEAP